MERTKEDKHRHGGELKRTVSNDEEQFVLEGVHAGGPRFSDAISSAVNIPHRLRHEDEGEDDDDGQADNFEAQKLNIEQLVDDDLDDAEDTTTRELERARYLNTLLEEKKYITPFKGTLPTCVRLLDEEIERVQGGGDPPTTPTPITMSSSLPSVPSSGFRRRNGSVDLVVGSPVLSDVGTDLTALYVTPGEVTETVAERGTRYSEKLYVPVDKYPNYNFVGRILGPRGLSLRRIEVETSCKIMIRGKGSVRNKQKEEEARGRPGWGHLDEPLHVLCTIETTDRQKAQRALSKARRIIQQLLVPMNEGNDFVKQSQLRELALLKTAGNTPSFTPSVSPFAARSNGSPPPHFGNGFPYGGHSYPLTPTYGPA